MRVGQLTHPHLVIYLTDKMLHFPESSDFYLKSSRMLVTESLTAERL